MRFASRRDESWSDVTMPTVERKGPPALGALGKQVDTEPARRMAPFFERASLKKH